MNAGYTQMFTFSYCKIKLVKLEPVCEFIQTLLQAKSIIVKNLASLACKNISQLGLFLETKLGALLM